MIIGFSGYARAGKDTCADIICRTHRNYCKISCEIASKKPYFS